MWGQLLLFITSIFCLYIVIAKINSKNNDIKSVLIAAIVVWIGSQFFYSGDSIQIENTISEILHILKISLVLTILLIIVRSLRPAIFRYPYLLVYSPLMIPFFFLLIIDTDLIKNIIFMTTQGIAILVYLLLLTENQAVAHKTKFGLIAVLMILISYVCYWFLLDLHSYIGTISKILLSLGILLSIYSFTKISEPQLNYMNE